MAVATVLMLRTSRYARPAQMDVRKKSAQDALDAYARLLQAGSTQDAPVVLGQLASALGLVLQAVEEAGL